MAENSVIRKIEEGLRESEAKRRTEAAQKAAEEKFQSDIDARADQIMQTSMTSAYNAKVDVLARKKLGLPAI